MGWFVLQFAWYAEIEEGCCDMTISALWLNVSVHVSECECWLLRVLSRPLASGALERLVVLELLCALLEYILNLIEPSVYHLY